MQPANTDYHSENQTPLYRDKTLLTIFAASLTAYLGVASVTPAFPKLAQALNIPPQEIGLLISVYAFPAFALGPIIGVLGDRLGRKKIIVPSLIFLQLQVPLVP